MAGDSEDPCQNDSNKIPSDQPPTELCKQKHRNSEKLFKNLLRPIELLSKKNSSCEQPLQYDLLKELDSYLVHIRTYSDDLCSKLMFIQAAILFQNVTFLYQKRVDQAYNDMMNLNKKFQAYRLSQKNNNNDEEEDVNKNKINNKKEKRNFSFEPINKNVMPSLKQFDCKIVNLIKVVFLQKVILNTNIQVNYKYSQILPYISIQNRENVGKKYDFKVNGLLNCNLAVDDEFDCSTSPNIIPTNPLLCPMDIDVVDFNDIIPNDPHPDNNVFNKTIDDEVRFCNRILLPADIGNVINVSEIHVMLDDDDDEPWPQVTESEHDIYSDVPNVHTKVHQHKNNGRQKLPSYTVNNYCNEYSEKLRKDIDPVFSKTIYEAQKAQRLEIQALKKKHVNSYEKEDEEQLDNEAFHENNDVFLEVEEQQPLVGDHGNNYQTYVDDMRTHKEKQLKAVRMNEQLEMRKRVEDWHDKLRPILADEERRTVFDVHEYGTRVLNCFQFIGQQKSFKDLVRGLGQEEVSRYFLSILMMANTYNLKIYNGLNGEIIIELLKNERHHEELQVNIGNQMKQN